MLTHLAPAPPLGPRLCLALSLILRKSACPCSGPRIRSRARALRPGSGTGQKTSSRIVTTHGEKKRDGRM